MEASAFALRECELLRVSRAMSNPTTAKKKSDKVYIAPSGVQKERIEPAHIFVLPFPSPDGGGNSVFLRRPSLDLRESACTPLFWNAFDLRGAGSCIHTHSQNAVMVTLLTPGNMFRISHQVRDFFFPFSLSVLKKKICLFFMAGGIVKICCMLCEQFAHRNHDR